MNLINACMKLFEEKKKYFIVTCHGWSGSHWLSCAINLHPDIVCSHSARNIIANPEIYGKNQEELKKSVVKRRQSHQIRHSSIDDIFSQIETYHSGKYYGCVHTLRLRDLDTLHQKKVVKSYKTFNLIRHPVSLVESGYGQILSMSEYDIFVKTDTYDSIRNEQEYFFQLAAKYNLNLCDDRVASFCCALFHLIHIDSDLKSATESTHHVMMENIVSDRAYFCNNLKTITSDFLKIDDVYLDKVFSLGKINKHKISSKRFTPKEQYDEWETWKKEGFSYFIEKTSIKNIYEKVGYDFSFI